MLTPAATTEADADNRYIIEIVFMKQVRLFTITITYPQFPQVFQKIEQLCCCFGVSIVRGFFWGCEGMRGRLWLCNFPELGVRTKEL